MATAKKKRREDYTLVISLAFREVCLFMLRLVHSCCRCSSRTALVRFGFSDFVYVQFVGRMTR